MRGRPISRILSQGLPLLDDHSSDPVVADMGYSRQPGPAGAKEAPPTCLKTHAARGPYLALLPVGLAMPPLLPAARWALTPPFHPYLPTIQSELCNGRRFIFCGAFRRVTPPGRYPAPFLFGVRTFLPSTRRHQSGHPAFRARCGLRPRQAHRQCRCCSCTQTSAS